MESSLTVLKKLAGVLKPPYYLIWILVFLFITPMTFTHKGKKRYSWPIKRPFIIGNLFHTPITLGQSFAYFHHGIDLVAKEGSSVYAVANGIGQMFYDPYDPNYRSGVVVRSNNGLTWVYLHLIPASIPSNLDYMSGTKVKIHRGDQLGRITNINWRFPHLHLELWKGGRPINPMRYLKPLKDSKPPEIKEILFCKNHSEDYFQKDKEETYVLSGDVDIVANIRDLIPPSPYDLDPYKIAYKITPLDHDLSIGIPKTVVYKFDTLPGVENVPPVKDFNIDPFVIDLKGKIHVIFKFSGTYSTRNNYLNHKRQYYYVLTNSSNGTINDRRGFWDTDSVDDEGDPIFPDGVYKVKVYAYDYYGNRRTRSIQVLINNN